MKLNVVTTSTRPGRIGPSIAQWFVEAAQAHDAGFDIIATDLAEVGLPLLDEPHHPKEQNYQHDHTKRWSAIVAQSDAFVFVLPEYNFTAPPGFVNAVDYLWTEWQHKPAGFVSYGGISGGLRSVQTAKLLLTSVSVMPIPEQVVIPNVFGQIADDVFTPQPAQTHSAAVMLTALSRWAEALAGMRQG